MGIEVWAELKIYDFQISHEEVTKLLGITPTRAYNKGDDLEFINKKSPFRIADTNFWEITSEKDLQPEIDYTEIVEFHILNLLEKLNPVKEIFLEIINNADGRINMVVNCYDWSPYIEVRKKVLKQLAEFNLDIFFDLYYLGDPDIEEENENKE